jgi:WXG100 family type VII secretion target
MVNKIEVNYDDLQNLGSRFSQNYDRWQQYTQLLKTRVNHVYATWEGKGADMFEHEMENLVLPAIQRMSQALHTGQETCKKIGQTFHDCEEEAGSLFKTDDGGGAIPVIIRKRTGLGGREQCTRYGLCERNSRSSRCRRRSIR